jgi:hypothetical protein
MRSGGIGGSLFLVALGAILYWAVSVDAEGFDINTIGLILMIVGVVGLLLTLIMTASESRARETRAGGVTIVERDKPATDVTIVEHERLPEDDH